MDIYAKFYQNILFPFYEGFLRKRNTLKYLKELEKNQWLPYEKLQEIQWNKLKKLLEHAYKNAPYYKRMFNGKNLKQSDIRTAEDFRKLPLISKDDIRTNKKDMIAENFRGKTSTKATGGSTGIPLELDYDTDSYQWRMAVAMRGYRWAGCEDGKKTAYIWGAPIGKENIFIRAKRNLHNVILRKKMLDSFKFSEEIMEKYLNEINSFKPEVIVGYTTPLYNFAKFIKEKQKQIIPIKSAITAAEKLYDYQREVIESVFKCKVFTTYGSREFMLIAAECKKHDGMHINIDNLYVEIVKNDGGPAREGEFGEVVITDLHNYGMPFIRYKIGDLGIATDRRCSCGRGLPLIDRIEGRILDTIKTSDGRIIPGEFFPHLMKEFKWVKQFQVIQEDIDNLIIKIIKIGNLKENELKMMQNEICKTMGGNIEIDFQFLDHIPLTKTGKFRVTISKVNQNFI